MFLFGSSSGAVLALDGASRLGRRSGKYFFNEPPFIVDGSHPAVPESLAQKVAASVAADKRDEAVGIFFREAMGIPPVGVTFMRLLMPAWKDMAQDGAHGALRSDDPGGHSIREAFACRSVERGNGTCARSSRCEERAFFSFRSPGAEPDCSGRAVSFSAGFGSRCRSDGTSRSCCGDEGILPERAVAWAGECYNGRAPTLPR